MAQANAERLPFADVSLDAVTCIYLFHELPPRVRPRVAAEIARVLKPGGVLAFADSIQPVDEPRLERMLVNFPAYFHEPFYGSYSETDLPALFAEAGLTVVDGDKAFLTKAILFEKAALSDIDALGVRPRRRDLFAHDNQVLYDRLASRCAPELRRGSTARDGRRDALEWMTGARPITDLHQRAAATSGGYAGVMGEPSESRLVLPPGRSTHSMLALVEQAGGAPSRDDLLQHRRRALGVQRPRVGRPHTTRSRHYLSFEIGLLKPTVEAFRRGCRARWHRAGPVAVLRRRPRRMWKRRGSRAFRRKCSLTNRRCAKFSISAASKSNSLPPLAGEATRVSER